MENLIKVLPIIIVLVLVFLIKEGFAILKYMKHCKLHEAAKGDDIEKMRGLIEQGQPVNALDTRFGLTPLHFAVRNGHMAAAKLLIDHGASLFQPSAQGITPLDWTSEYLSIEQRETLLRHADEHRTIEDNQGSKM